MATKLIYINTVPYKREDDLSYPYRMEINLSPPEGIAAVAFAFIHGGSETVITIGNTVAELQQFAADNDHLEVHPRLRWIHITDRAGKVVISKEGRNGPWLEAKE